MHVCIVVDIQHSARPLSEINGTVKSGAQDAEGGIMLKPCPFCGGKAVLTKSMMRTAYVFVAQCTECRAESPGSAFKNDEFNTHEWNRRAVIDSNGVTK